MSNRFKLIDSTSIKYNLEVNKNNIVFNSINIAIRGIGYFSNGIFTGKYQNLKGETFLFSMTRDSLLQNTEKKFVMQHDTIIPSIWTPNKAYGNRYDISALPTILRNATVWTNEDEGIIENTDVAINNGKIIARVQDHLIKVDCRNSKPPP